MSMKVLQFPERGSTRAIRVRAIPKAWLGAYAVPRDTGFLSSWFAEDPDSEAGINWGAISGLALALAVSVAFWAGVGLIVERFLR